MLIEFRCTNASEFDAAKGRYVECGESIITSDDNVGRFIVCPKCKEPVEVPIQTLAASESRKSKQSRSRKRPVRGKSTGDSDQPNIVAATRAGTPNLTAQDDLSRTPDVMEMEFPEGAGPSIHTADRKRCPECGCLLSDDGQCSLCRYVEPKFLSQSAALDDIPIQLAGLQLWLSQVVSDGVSIPVLAFVFTALLTIAFLVLSTVLILIGGSTQYILVGLLTMMYGFYLYALAKARQMARDPRARVGFILRPFWNLVLFIARLMNWQGYESRLKGRVVIDLRNAPVTDDKIPHLENLRAAHVLDLQNTMITDQALTYLYGLPNLHCLVVRKTKVTPEAVFRLQQANRRLWIWD